MYTTCRAAHEDKRDYTSFLLSINTLYTLGAIVNGIRPRSQNEAASPNE